ncbi:MAG: 2-phospho-L-lactate guanylyltransferase [Chloroflexota bacterium]
MSTESDADRPSALEPIHVVLPMRTVSGGKARLGGALDAEEREELVLGMLLNTLAVLGRWQACRRIHLVSPDPVIDAATRQTEIDLAIHRQPGQGLNAAIRQGVEAALSDDAPSLLVLPGDLPHLTVEALDGLTLAADAGLAAAAGGALVAIAPSDARSGTNALLLKPPDVIAPAFGIDSFEAHLRAAAAVDAAVQVVSDPVLGFDLDTPDDLERLDPARLRELMALGRDAIDGVST